MALRFPARTKATTLTSGTGPFFLTEALQSGYRTFSKATTDNDLSDGDTVPIIIIDTTVADGPNLLQIATAQWNNTDKSLTIIQTYQPGGAPPSWGSNVKDVVVVDNPVLFALLAGGVLTGLLAILISGTQISQATETALLIQRSGASNSNVGVSLISGTSGTSTLNLGDTASENVGGVRYDNSTNTLYTRTNGADGPRINSSGQMLDSANILYTPLPGGGVTKTEFCQATAPPYWTKDTSNNDKALRVVSGGTGGTSGGSRPLSSTNTGDHVVTLQEIPSHRHAAENGDFVTNAVGTFVIPSGGIGATVNFYHNSDWIGGATGAGGGEAASGHNHNLSLAYIDVIVCSKN